MQTLIRNNAYWANRVTSNPSFFSALGLFQRFGAAGGSAAGMASASLPFSLAQTQGIPVELQCGLPQPPHLYFSAVSNSIPTFMAEASSSFQNSNNASNPSQQRESKKTETPQPRNGSKEPHREQKSAEKKFISDIEQKQNSDDDENRVKSDDEKVTVGSSSTSGAEMGNFSADKVANVDDEPKNEEQKE